VDAVVTNAFGDAHALFSGIDGVFASVFMPADAYSKLCYGAVHFILYLLNA